MVIQRRFELATVCLCVAQSVAFLLLLWNRGMTFSLAGSSPVILAIAFLLTLGLVYRRFRNELVLSGAVWAAGYQIWALSITGAVTVVTASWRLPLIDAELLQIDHVLGFDSTRFSALLGSIPGAGGILDAVYWVSFPAVLALTFALFLSGQRHHGAAVTFLFVLTLTACALVGSLLPATGPLVYHPLLPDEAKGLPAYAGVWYMAGIESYRSGAAKIVDFTQPAAVLTFPSFHTCMLLIFLWGARPLAWLRWPFSILSALTFLSVFPIGGHYLADAIGAVATVVPALAVVRRLRVLPAFEAARQRDDATAAPPDGSEPGAGGRAAGDQGDIGVMFFRGFRHAPGRSPPPRASSA
jgi:hypothetical protein